MKGLFFRLLPGIGLLLSVSTLFVHAQELVFSPPTTLNSNAASDNIFGSDFNPEVITDSAGIWITVWMSNTDLSGTRGSDVDIFVAHSKDNGHSWSPAKALNTNAHLDSGDDMFPRLVTDEAGNWVAVWGSDENLGNMVGSDFDILVSRSIDNGVSWSEPATLNNNADSDTGDDIIPQITTDKRGNWVAVWRSDENLGGTAGTDWDIFIARSMDNGISWSTPETLNSNADSDMNQDYFSDVISDGSGNWIAVWESGDTAGIDTDIFYSRSTDNSVSWSEPETLNGNADTDSGSDWSPEVTTDGAGNWVAVWESYESLHGTAGSDGDIFVARSTDNGASWSTPMTLNSNANSDIDEDRWPKVTTDGVGNWVTVWYSSENLGGTVGWDHDIFVSRSTDNGASWSATATLNSNATSDEGTDRISRITTDRLGNWVVVWVSDDDLDGMVGTDKDIFVATAFLEPFPPSIEMF